MAAVFSSEESLMFETNDRQLDQKAAEGRISENYMEMISTLLREKGWTTEHMYQYQGFWYPFNGGRGRSYAGAKKFHGTK